MPVFLRDLFNASGLNLVDRSSAEANLDASISWVSITELDDPTPFLSGDEVLLTTAMRRRGASEWESFVRRLVDADVSGLGVGIGNVLPRIPRALVAAAQRWRMPLFEVPVETPFIKISQWVGQRLFAEQYATVRRAAEAQDQLVRAVLSRSGLDTLVGAVRRLNRGPACVIDTDGALLTSSPRKFPWPATDIAVGRAIDPSFTVSAIDVEGVTVAFLCTESSEPNPDLVSFAANLIGLEVARRQALLTGRRELLGQVFEDLFHRIVADDEAGRRLIGYGVDLDRAHRVVTLHVSSPSQTLKLVPWNIKMVLGSEAHRGITTALVGDDVMLLVPEDQDVEMVARGTADILRRIDPDVRVGIGGPHDGVSGLRISYFEGLQAAQRGPGIHRATALSLSSLLLNDIHNPLREASEATLQPLIEHDEAHDGALVETLSTYFANDLTVNRTARDLFIHRNTLNYRLRQIERLTGRSLAGLGDQLELLLALKVMASSPPASAARRPSPTAGRAGREPPAATRSTASSTGGG